MNLASFKKRLTKELQRGGKKSIVLGVLLLVGLFVWAPMIWRKLMTSSDSASAVRTPTKTDVTTKPASKTALEKPEHAVAVEWKSLYRRIEGSELIQPVKLDEITRDPFERTWLREKSRPVVLTSQDHAADDPIKKLMLSAVLAGADGGAAVINDIVYRVGQPVPENGSFQYVLKEIRADRVVLQRGEKVEVISLYDMQLPVTNPPEPGP